MKASELKPGDYICVMFQARYTLLEKIDDDNWLGTPGFYWADQIMQKRHSKKEISKVIIPVKRIKYKVIQIEEDHEEK